MRISDWSSDVCSSDLIAGGTTLTILGPGTGSARYTGAGNLLVNPNAGNLTLSNDNSDYTGTTRFNGRNGVASLYFSRSEEHTSELQSLMRISYAVFCLKKKKQKKNKT